METTTSPADAPASRETDVRVARAMGWTEFIVYDGDYMGTTPTGKKRWRIPMFTDEVRGYGVLRESLAWLRGKSYPEICPGSSNSWFVYVFLMDVAKKSFSVHAPSLPLAVARAVLMVGE